MRWAGNPLHRQRKLEPMHSPATDPDRSRALDWAVDTGFGVLRVSGQRLTLLAMTGEELRIGGLIDRVEWVTGC